MNPKPKILIFGISSDIGIALAKHWLEFGAEIIGTYRRMSPKLSNLKISPDDLFSCDFSSKISIERTLKDLQTKTDNWDAAIFCQGTMNPLGPFTKSDIDEWEKSFQINFLSIMRILHFLLPSRSKQGHPIVITFAGGGTNSAPRYNSSYVSSKIALTKSMELLDAEYEDTRFSILGPGWVKTKIHTEMLDASDDMKREKLETSKRLSENNFVPMSDVVELCHYLFTTKSKALSGRNFSAAHDKWKSKNFLKFLSNNQDAYKLRRHSNEVGIQ